MAVGRHSSAAPRSPLSVRVAQDDEDSVYESCPHIKETLAAVLKLCKAEDETTRQVYTGNRFKFFAFTAY